MRSRLGIFLIGALWLSGCAPTRPQSAGGAYALPTYSLIDLITQSDIVFFGRVRKYKVFKGEYSGEESKELLLGSLRLEVLQVLKWEYRMDFIKNILMGEKELLVVVATTGYELRKFQEGERHIFCVIWMPETNIFSLHEDYAKVGEIPPLKVPKKVMDSLLADKEAQEIHKVIEVGRDPKGREERAAAMRSYLTRLNRKLLEYASNSGRLDDPKTTTLQKLLPDYNLDESALSGFTPDTLHYGRLGGDPLSALHKYGYMRECRKLEELLMNMVAKCKNKELKVELKELSESFGKYKELLDEMNEAKGLETE